MGDMIKIGPAGGKCGNAWDEKGRTNIIQIFVSHNEYGINSIQFQYAENGTLLLSQKHGAVDGSNFDVVKLNYPSEYITRVSGRCNSGVCSITFCTNRGEYGPFGGGATVYVKEFSFKLGDDQQFGGFHGTVHLYRGLESIGIYLNPNIISDEIPLNHTNMRLLQY